VRPSVAIGTVAAHAIVIGGMLVFHFTRPLFHHEEPPQPRSVDVDVVVPEPLVPPVAPMPSITPGGASSTEPAPAPPRVRPQRRSARPATVAAPVAPRPDPAAETFVEADLVPGSSSGIAAAGSGTGAGTGSGTGIGNGNGSGAGDRDLSGPPVPLKALSSQTLPYTEQAARARITGDVKLEIFVGADGRVTRTTIRSALGYGLDEIAQKLAIDFLFKPATDRTGKPTTGSVRWRFHFEPP
jgi:periplasmic protein TonB